MRVFRSSVFMPSLTKNLPICSMRIETPKPCEPARPLPPVAAEVTRLRLSSMPNRSSITAEYCSRGAEIDPRPAEAMKVFPSVPGDALYFARSPVSGFMTRIPSPQIFLVHGQIPFVNGSIFHMPIREAHVQPLPMTPSHFG